MILKKVLTNPKQSKTFENSLKLSKTVQNWKRDKLGGKLEKFQPCGVIWLCFFPTLYSKLYNHDITVEDSDSEINCSLLP